MPDPEQVYREGVDNCHLTIYNYGQSVEKRSRLPMILKIRHKGLKQLHRKGSTAKVNPDHAGKLHRILARLEASSSPADMDLPGYRLHPLRGDYRGFYGVEVSGNWRVVFRFEGEHATDVDYVDYH